MILKPEHGDVIANYQTVVGVDINTAKMVHALAQKDNGDCVYLGENGCTIYEDRPSVCRGFDCRVAYLSFTRAMREEQQDPKWIEAEKRLHTLDARRRRAAIQVRKLREKGIVV